MQPILLQLLAQDVAEPADGFTGKALIIGLLILAVFVTGFIMLVLKCWPRTQKDRSGLKRSPFAKLPGL